MKTDVSFVMSKKGMGEMDMRVSDKTGLVQWGGKIIELETFNTFVPLQKERRMAECFAVEDLTKKDG